MPQKIRTDKRTTFWKSDSDESNNTPLANALKQLNCCLSSSSDPKFKPTVERTFGALQSFLVAKARLNKILNESDFLGFLDFEISAYNKKLLTIRRSIQVFFKPALDKELEMCFNHKFQRTITSGCTVLIKNEHYEALNNSGLNILVYPKRTIKVYESILIRISIE